MAFGFAAKKKKGKKGAKKAKAPPLDPAIAALTLPDLKDLTGAQQQSLEQSKKDRNFYQLERDKIFDFLSITKDELNELRDTLKLKDREVEANEEKHQIELKVYKQKVRHMTYEHKITMDRLKIENDTHLKEEAEQFEERQNMLRKEKKRLKDSLDQEASSHDENVRQMKAQHARMLARDRKDYQDRLKQITDNYEKMLNDLTENMKLRAQKEESEMETRKNTHIKQLVEKHKECFEEIKEYYKKITTDNLKLIKTLKNDLETMQKNELNNEQLMFEIAQENKKLAEPLEVVKDEVKHLKQQLNTYEKDKLSLKNASARLQVLQSELKMVQEDYSHLEKNYENVENERDDLYDRFERAIDDVQDRTRHKNQLLEEEVNRLQDELMQRDAELKEAMRAANLTEMDLQDMENEGWDGGYA
mmetsp:Transcript_5086/g.19066  ORF Transcript_5086/g.19066 Transcript_5086/m.19066 type:complete len:418 (-) Transcript_5086:1747-3000(-)|eukprot:CAMPEP_0117456284 /NCGR_PEP_ID=MMETSP0759-20121206/11797_1 /TAXON_ID=63605 /ORGANISM="Percolomonas cosmopolitus, Strain WS" /LENGTH=417 /DNA_ID=CAMNT_0005249617 /DNA_START=259 /DNA_END=1512 /DNA_ORIENTATION=-